MHIPHELYPIELTGINSPRGPWNSLITVAKAEQISGHIITNHGARTELIFSYRDDDQNENKILSPITNVCSGGVSIERSEWSIAYFLSKHIQRSLVESVPGVFQPEWGILQDMRHELGQANRLSPELVISPWPVADVLPIKEIAEYIKNKHPVWFSGFPVDIELSTLLTRDEKVGRSAKEIEVGLKKKFTELHETGVSMLMIGIPNDNTEAKSITPDDVLVLFNRKENDGNSSSFFIKPSWGSSQGINVLRVTIDNCSIKVETKCADAMRKLNTIQHEFEGIPRAVTLNTHKGKTSEMLITWSNLNESDMADLLCSLIECIPSRIVESEIPAVKCQGGKFEVRFILQDSEFWTRRDTPCQYELTASYGKISSTTLTANISQGANAIKTTEALKLCFKENFPHLSPEEINQKVKDLFDETTSVAHQIAQKLSLWNKYVCSTLGVHSYWMNGLGAHGFPDIALDFSFMVDPKRANSLMPCFLEAGIDYECSGLDLVESNLVLNVALTSESIRSNIELEDSSSWNRFRRRMLHPHDINI